MLRQIPQRALPQYREEEGKLMGCRLARTLAPRDVSGMPNVAPPEPELESTAEPGADALLHARNAADGNDKRRYVQGMFSAIAPRYDLLNHVLSMNVDKAWRRKAISALRGPGPNRGTYLDLCAGTLDVGAALTRTPGFDGFVIGADFAFPMLQHGMGKAPRSVLTPVTADALALPFANQSLDGCIVAFGIRNVASLDAGLAEVFRVLKPGARFVILEFSTPPRAVVRSLYHAYFHYVLPAIGRLVSGHTSAYTYLPLSVSKFPAGPELVVKLQQAGFADVSWQSLTLGVAAIHVGSVPKGAAANPPRAHTGRPSIAPANAAHPNITSPNTVVPTTSAAPHSSDRPQPA